MRLGTFALLGTLALGATTGSLGCRKLLKGEKTDASATAAAPSPRTPQDDADEAMQDKISGYILCLNTLSAPVHATRSRYFSWVNPKTGPTGQEPVVLGLFDLPIDKVTTCSQAVAKSNALAPKEPKIEAAGTEFARTVSELDAIIDEVFTYYETKGYQIDKFAKGKATHKRLIDAFDAFSRADEKLHATLDGIAKPIAQRTLARIEREEGKGFQLPPQARAARGAGRRRRGRPRR